MQAVTHGLCGCKRGRCLNKELSITEEKRKRNAPFHHEYGGESFGILEKEESKIFSERELRICICFAVNMKNYNFFKKDLMYDYFTHMYHVCARHPNMSEEVSNPLELEPQVSVKTPRGFQEPTWSSARAATAEPMLQPKDYDVKNKNKNTKINPANKRERLSTWRPLLFRGGELKLIGTGHLPKGCLRGQENQS